ncbi:zonular occludens toxin domain-containing protein [Actinosynnema sp. CS-041913]|uniref:zonular occludens toxin domain-containing protein n=1 Tax=Actinosynnema sp. CS-041913 TaxID=3239917 RepID=UPI003D91502D
MTTTTAPTPDPDDVPDNVRALRPDVPGPDVGPAEIEPATVVEGEILSEEESADLDRRLAAQSAARAVVARTRVAGRKAAPVARGAGRWVLRNAGYAVAGSRIRREERRNRRRHLDLEQAITTLRVNARNSEDFHVLRELEETLERRRSGVAQRGRERRIEVLRWSGGVILLVGGVHVVVLGYAAAQAVLGAGSLTDRWTDVVGFWTTVAELSPVGGYWWVWAVGGAVSWAARTIPAGRSRGTLPMWAVDTEAVPADGRSIIPDESSVLTALRHLSGLPKLKEAFKKGWGTSVTPMWVQPPVMDGKGWRMQLVLPLGVPVEEIVKRKTVLAHNLVRTPTEVWPSEPKGQAGVLDLWVANPGALSGPVDPWPLLDGDGPTDYFTGIPVGVNIRGEQVVAQLFQRNYVAGGVMGSGKSSLYITLVAGAVLDPLVEVDVFVFAENFDYEPLRPRLRTLRTSGDKETVKACLDTLEALYGELETRGKALRENKERAVNRKVAERDARLRPRVVVLDECQILFMDEDYGERAADVVMKLVSTARKYAVTIMFATPEASTQSLPRKVTAVTSCKACFAIGDQQGNDAVLGTGSYKAGISSVDLEPSTDEGPGDVGTAMVRGIMAKPGVLRCHYLNAEELADVAARAMELRAAHAPARSGDHTDREPAPDFLTDLARALGDQTRMRTAVALRALIDHNPDHYGDWTAKTFAAALRDTHVPIRKSDGDSLVKADDITEAITLRDNEQGDDTDDDDA